VLQDHSVRKELRQPNIRGGDGWRDDGHKDETQAHGSSSVPTERIAALTVESWRPTAGGVMTRVELTISADSAQVGEPWIWRLSRDFNMRVTILKANVDADFGWMQIALEGPIEEVQRATAWLHTTGMHIDPAQRSVGA
jgi:hypothetical protein